MTTYLPFLQANLGDESDLIQEFFQSCGIEVREVFAQLFFSGETYARGTCLFGHCFAVVEGMIGQSMCNPSVCV